MHNKTLQVRTPVPGDSYGPAITVPEDDLAMGDGKWIHYGVTGKYGVSTLCQRDKFVIGFDSTKVTALVTCPACLKTMGQV